jgi:hypothetical protein
MRPHPSTSELARGSREIQLSNAMLIAFAVA